MKADGSPLPVQILLVEDNEADVQLVRLGLEAQPSFRHQLHVAYDGEEALDFLHRRGRFQNAPTPDLILLDLNLPKKSGIEVLTAVKQTQILRRTPTIILTSSQAETDVNSAYDQGANAYMRKPRSLDDIFDLTRVLGEHWMRATVLPSQSPYLY
jgi:CheY-like chemotaxis protein